MTSNEAKRLDNSNPEFERAGAFEGIKEVTDNSAQVFQFVVDADSTAGLVALTAPFPMVVTDIVWVTTVGVADTGAVSVLNGTTEVCTALVATTAKAVSRPVGGIELAKLILAKGDTLKVDANGATITGTITFIGKKL
jgi:hypothetical protein